MPFIWINIIIIIIMKNFNLGHNFLTRRDRALILHMFIPCDKTFHKEP